MKNNIFITLFIFFLLWIPSASAVIVPKLYAVELPIADFSQAARQQAFPKALQQVLIKTSGNAEIASLPEIQASLSSAYSLINSYSYSEPDTDNGKQQQLFLNVKFNPKGIEQLLNNAKQGLWGNNRPLILTWLDIDDTIIASNNDDDIVNALIDNAKRLGLPIILPVTDLPDFNNISTENIKQLNISAIKKTSKRYNTDTILVGYITKVEPDNWQGSWTLLLNDSIVHWDITGINPTQILTKAMNNVANSLSTQFAVLNDSATRKQLTVLITGVTGLNEYSDISKYLRGLNTVTEVDLTDAGPNYVKLQVTNIGGIKALVNATNTDNKLILDQSDTEDPNIDIIYHLANPTV